MRLLFLIFALGVSACSRDSVHQNRETNGVIGSWLLFERGFSPGDRYIVEEVPPVPAQLIRFKADSSFETNIEGYKSFNRFRIKEQDDAVVLILYSGAGVDHQGNISFTMSNSGQRLELRAHGCIEGCHEAYRPVSDED